MADNGKNTTTNFRACSLSLGPVPAGGPIADAPWAHYPAQGALTLRFCCPLPLGGLVSEWEEGERRLALAFHTHACKQKGWGCWWPQWYCHAVIHIRSLMPPASPPFVLPQGMPEQVALIRWAAVPPPPIYQRDQTRVHILEERDLGPFHLSSLPTILCNVLLHKGVNVLLKSKIVCWGLRGKFFKSHSIWKAALSRNGRCLDF